MTESLVTGSARFPVAIETDDEDVLWSDPNVIAGTVMRIRCRDAGVRRRCIEALRARQQHMRSRPDVRDAIRFVSALTEPHDSGAGVIVIWAVWYDEQYFTDRAPHLLGSLHSRIFASFGLGPGDVQIRHWRPETPHEHAGQERV
jgi:hypothetical protein